MHGFAATPDRVRWKLVQTEQQHCLWIRIGHVSIQGGPKK